MDQKSEPTYQYSCGYDCPFWDSGQGYDHSSCHVPNCLPFDCHRRHEYTFNPDDFIAYLKASFFPQVEAIFHYARTDLFRYRHYIEARLQEFLQTTSDIYIAHREAILLTLSLFNATKLKSETSDFTLIF